MSTHMSSDRSLRLRMLKCMHTLKLEGNNFKSVTSSLKFSSLGAQCSTVESPRLHCTLPRSNEPGQVQ